MKVKKIEGKILVCYSYYDEHFVAFDDFTLDSLQEVLVKVPSGSAVRLTAEVIDQNQ